jgi:heat shock protein HslJ
MPILSYPEYASILRGKNEYDVFMASCQSSLLNMRNDPMKVIWMKILILLFAVLLLVACSPSTSTAPTSAPALENTTWVLESFGQPGNLKSVLKDTEITALFDSAQDQVSGSAGVNRYFGAYKLDGDKLVISGPIASTAMGGPQTFMDQEQEYLSAFQAAENYKIDGSILTITCGGKILIFRKK